MDRDTYIVFPISGATIIAILLAVAGVVYKAYCSLREAARFVGVVLPVIVGVICIALIVKNIKAKCWGNVVSGLLGDIFFLMESYCFAGQISGSSGSGLWNALMWLIGFAAVGLNYVFGILGWLLLNGNEEGFYGGYFVKGALLLGISCGLYYWLMTAPSMSAGGFLGFIGIYVLMGIISGVDI